MSHASTTHSSRHYGALLAFLLLTQAAGAAGGLVTYPQIAGWYAQLAKPSFNPPGWIFGPVWTTLYVLMAVAAWRVWRVAGLRSRPMIVFFVQLALNTAWSFIFFGAHAVGWALAEVAVLLLIIVWTAIAFVRRDRAAGLLMLPYVAWVSFATLLNAAIWKLN